MRRRYAAARGAGAAVALAALATALPAAGHEVLHEVVRGRAIAVHASYADGEPLAYVAFEVFSPADPRIPHLKGRTDRNGWLAFVPDAAGSWRVRIADTTGHGLETTVDVAAPGAAEAPANAGAPAGAAFVLRPVIGALLAAAIFAALFVYQRRKGRIP